MERHKQEFDGLLDEVQEDRNHRVAEPAHLLLQRGNSSLLPRNLLLQGLQSTSRRIASFVCQEAPLSRQLFFTLPHFGEHVLWK